VSGLPHDSVDHRADLDMLVGRKNPTDHAKLCIYVARWQYAITLLLYIKVSLDSPFFAAQHSLGLAAFRPSLITSKIKIVKSASAIM
jgi:hypothetical protein